MSVGKDRTTITILLHGSGNRIQLQWHAKTFCLIEKLFSIFAVPRHLRMESEHDIKQIVKDVSEGSFSAFRLLFDMYYSKVYWFADNIIKNGLYADEIAQMVFVKLWNRRATLDPEKNFDSFLYIVSRHAVLDFIKLNRRSLEAQGLEAAADTPNPSGDSSYQTEYRILQKLIDKIVEAMPEQRRKIFIMSRYRLMDNDAIASELGISKRTVERHLNLALNALRKEIKTFAFLAVFISFFQ